MCSNRVSASRSLVSAPAPQPRSPTRRAPRSRSTARMASRRWTASGFFVSASAASASADGVVQLFRLGVVGLGQPGQRGPGEPFLVRQVAAGDELLLRVPGQPVAAGPDQLVHLVGRHPVVLGVVEHGQQHVQVVERVGQPQLAGQPQVQVRGVAPFGGRERLAARVDAASRGGRRRGPRGRRRRGSAARGRAARAGWGPAASSGRASQRPVSAVRKASLIATASRLEAAYGRSLTYWASSPPPALAVTAVADQGDRVDLEQQRGRAPLRRRLRVEDVRRARRQRRTTGPGPGACAAGTPGRSRARGWW